jgi:hypothetical protein
MSEAESITRAIGVGVDSGMGIEKTEAMPFHE